MGVSCLQMLLVLTILQLAAPSMTKIIYETKNHTTVDYCSEPDHDASLCYSQGPLTIYRAVGLCPMLLFNGVLNLFYYFGEASMYNQPLGVLMIVLAALASSFIIAPMQSWFHLDGAKNVNVWAILLGVVGAVLCLIERTPKKKVPDASERDTDFNNNGSCSSLPPIHGSGERGALISPRRISDNNNNQMVRRYCLLLLRYLPLLGPFALLSFTYALYFVIMLYYNDSCKVNMWGYNSYDQVTLPLYFFPVFLGMEVISSLIPARWSLLSLTTTTPTADPRPVDETFLQACAHVVRELTDKKGAGLAHVFLYRLLINSRAVAYTYIAVVYDLSSSYLQLTLIRVVLSWIASVVLVLVVPKWIVAEVKEQEKFKDPMNITLKVAGSLAIVGSLMIIHYAS